MIRPSIALPSEIKNLQFSILNAGSKSLDQLFSLWVRMSEAAHDIGRGCRRSERGEEGEAKDGAHARAAIDQGREK